MHALAFLFLALLTAGRSRGAQDDARDARRRAFEARVALLDSIRLGDSATAVAMKLEPTFSVIRTNRFLGRYPFDRLLTYTNQAVVSEWQYNTDTEDERGDIVFAVFDGSSKTNLVDALWFNSRSIQPLVNGNYSRNLLSIKKGDSVQKLYHLVGRNECEYVRLPDGKWRVKFVYWAFEGRLIAVEADAETGIITRAYDGTI